MLQLYFTTTFKTFTQKENDVFTVVNVGRFTKVKNHTFIIDVFYELKKIEPNSKLILAGVGELLQNTKDKAERLGILEDVEFLNLCLDVPSLLSKCDVFLMPSIFEGLPVSLIEAQGANLPCVVSDSISREVNITGEIQFLSLNDSADVWAKKLYELKKTEKTDNRQKIIDAGYDIFTTAKMLSDFYLKKYNDLVVTNG